MYRDADLYLLDDPFSSIDKKTANELFEKCIGDYLKNKMVILVSHHSEYLMMCNSHYQFTSGVLEKVEKVSSYSIDIHEKSQEENFESNNKDEQTRDKTEDECKISWDSYILYFGSSVPTLFIFASIIFIGSTLLKIWYDKLLNGFLSEYKHPEAINFYKISPFITLLGIIVIMEYSKECLIRVFGYIASSNIHNKIFKKVMNSTMKFVAGKQRGYILNRFSRDLSVIDTKLLDDLINVITWLGIMIITSIFSCAIIPYLLFPFIIIILIITIIFVKILPRIRLLKKQAASKRTPLIQHVNNTLTGLLLIRGFQQQKNFMQKTFHTVDSQAHSVFLLFTTFRFLQVIINLLIVVFLFIVYISCIIVSQNIDPVYAALIIIYIQSSINPCQFAFKLLTETENDVIKFLLIINNFMIF